MDWLRTEGFTVYQLERMTPADLTAFVRQWHAAVREQGTNFPAPWKNFRTTNAPC